jgi:hypothetical protein
VEDLGDVGFDGAFGDVQPGGDGPVGQALGDQPEDLSFPLAEVGEGSCRRRRPTSRETIVGSITVSRPRCA